jgi:polysaccharide export outer membrane protein
VAPNQYEAGAKVALRVSSATTLNLDGSDVAPSGALASGQVQLETLGSVFRSDQLAWQVIVDQRLYESRAFMGRFPRRLLGFRADSPDPEVQAYLLERFQRRLTVQTLPNTLILQIRFRSGDPGVSAAVVNGLIRAFREQDADSRLQATADANGWLNEQLKDLKARVDEQDRKLLEFQKKHGILNTPETLANGEPGETQHTAALLEIDELGRELVSASADRILREAEYRAATAGDPELVLASDTSQRSANGVYSSPLLQQLHSRRSDLEQEQAQLRIEHGPNFPRVVEIRGQLQEIDAQIKVEDSKLVERFREAWKTAVDREQLVRKNLDERTAAGMKLSAAATQYAVMRQEATATHGLYTRVLERSEMAGLAAGTKGSSISVVDYARRPMKPVAPDPPLYLAITFFCSLWLAVGGALMFDSFGPAVARATTLALFLLAIAMTAESQAPTPSTSGLPTGVARIPLSTERKQMPNAKDAPALWKSAQGAEMAGVPPGAANSSRLPMPAPIGPGDFLEISESHSPEIHAAVRVSEIGTVVLTLAGEVKVSGMDERAAAHAIETALVERGMLLHPQVTVLVTAFAGQDVSVLGEVARPGIYSYTVHHRLLDLISAASGLGPNAGRLVTIIHRDDPNRVLPVVLDPTVEENAAKHNPELMPGDIVQVSRAGLVYVVGDVIRPGGFPVDPVQGLSLVQALSLAWGPSQNAALSKALLIRERDGGRTVTTLDLKKLLRGIDPDMPIRDGDIVFVPDSAAKNLWNRTMESVVQSAAGVSIYAGMVYSQRF